MQYILLRQISNYVDKKVRIKGWVTHIRPSGKLIFIEMSDGSGEIQCVVFKGDVDENVFNISKNLSIEASIIVDGVIRRENRSKIGYEIGVSNIEIIHQPKEEYPISPKKHGVAF